jgi:radical SAM superfamily enzyme YgiQ (UPF0313 family)
VPEVYTSENEPKNNKFQEYFHLDINTLPIPDLTLLPYKQYRSFLNNKQIATAVTSRGCPFRCVFCRSSNSELRMLSIDRVIEMALNERLIDHDLWKEYASNPVVEIPFITWDKEYSYEELEAVRKRPTMRFI